MDWLKLVCLSIGSLLSLFVLTKLIGNKQMSQLNFFDYINGITIGSIAAELATALDGAFWRPLTAMVIYSLGTLGINLLSQRSLRARRLFEGRALLLYDNGRIFRNNLRSARLDLSELLTQCRINGYFSLQDLQAVILESNGQFSFLPLSDKRPLQASDLQRKPPQACYLYTVILDGRILTRNLRAAGRDERWLEKELSARGLKASDTMYAAFGKDNTFLTYARSEEGTGGDLFA